MRQGTDRSQADETRFARGRRVRARAPWLWALVALVFCGAWRARRGMAQGRGVAHHVTPVAAAAQPAVPASAIVLTDDERGRAEGFYERLCTACHGPEGAGDGALARFLPTRPRDLVHEGFKWRSTPSGQRPTVDDVVRTIARGVPGAAMPAFGPGLAPRDRTLLARYVLAMDPRGRPPGVALSPLGVPAASEVTSAILARGAAAYERLQCGVCHGAGLRGDGPQAAIQTPRPYDLTTQPSRGGADAASILRGLRTGLDGTGMASFDGAAPDEDLVALALWVASRIPEAVASRRAPNDPGEAQWMTDDARGHGMAPVSSGLLRDRAREARERTFWEFPLRAQGAGPVQLTPAERSLEPDQCARCHARQFEQFRTTVHSRAMGPGVLGQLVDGSASDVRECQTCHAPLEEQSARIGGGAVNPAFDEGLRAQGVVCAACHLRERERFGPALHGASARVSGSMYPLTRLSRFERGDFCVGCHQHTMESAVNGRPVLNTVMEWVEGPYFARGVQCQSCHMPDRDHTWRGAHDPDAVRQAVRMTTRVRREPGAAGVVVAVVAVENVGAGHWFPGTATPAAEVRVEWLDAAGRAVGTPVVDVIQRRLEYTGGAWVEQRDTRIAPGGRRVVEARSGAGVAAVRVTLTFRPDEYYDGFYRREAAAQWRSAQGRRLLEEAGERARGTAFVVRSEVVRVE